MIKQKFNQCQDCGCQGSMIKAVVYDVNMGVMECPFCKRRGVPFVISRKDSPKDYIQIAIESWNVRNRENKEGL